MQAQFQISTYFSHLAKSFHLHGIHSPFVFQFEKKCLRDRNHFEEYLKLSRFRESLKKNNTILTVEDHGAGSRVFKSDQRAINKILKHNSSSLKTAKTLFRVARYFNAKRILELGTSLGIATQAFALSNPKAEITTIEGSHQLADFTHNNLKQCSISNVNLTNCIFQDYLEGKASLKPEGKYDLIYIDGHHDGKATLSYFEQLLPFAHNETVFILDDIYWSRDMNEAWECLKRNDQVTASIDTYDLGFLFLRKEQRQQCFHIYL
ncbi:MAG: class I SAM-dependent methyltransferase [Nonlabens sp.]